MLALQAAETDFLLLRGDLRAAQAKRRLARSPIDAATAVIIRRAVPALTYFVCTRGELAALLAPADEVTPLDELLHAALPAAVVTPFTAMAELSRAVVVEHGQPVGAILPPRWEAAADAPTFGLPEIALERQDFELSYEDEMYGEPIAKGIDELAAPSDRPSPPPQPAAVNKPQHPESISGESLAAEPATARALLAAAPEQVALGDLAPLQVSLSALGASPAGSLPVAAAAGETLDVLVKPVQGFAVEGVNLAALTVAGPEASLPLLFKLRATEMGVGIAQIYAFQAGQPLGFMTVTLDIVAAEPHARLTSIDRQDKAAAALTLPKEMSTAPDLTLFIQERPVGNETEVTIRLTAVDPTLGLNLKPFGPISLRMRPQEYFQEFFRDVERMPLQSPVDGQKAARRMARKGAQLFQTLFPADLQALLWSLRERIQAVQIQSEEPWIPWELCKLVGEESGAIVEGPYLCEAFAMTRWLPGIAQQPALSLKNVGLIAPGDSGLAFAAEEVAYLHSLTNATRQVTAIPATYLDVLDALEAGIYDGLHFTGHGIFRAPDPNHSAMELEAGDQLTPEDISGQVGNLGRAKPLVFLNACQLGRSDFSLTDIGGWAAQFLRAGAGAFIGAYWSVYDDSALAFARTLYAELLAGRPMAQAAHAARLAARADGDPSWLAYTIFAHPAARILE